jgi:adenylylsulfate kinase
LSDQPNKQIIWHPSLVDKQARKQLKGHKSTIVWLTGLSGSGKSTLAASLDKQLLQIGVHAYCLDGDNIRHGLNRDLGFSSEDRKENIRRIGEVAKLFVDAGIVVICAFISPFREDRDWVRKLVMEEEFLEIYIKCPIEECERRDTKGFYKKAREGEIHSFTGISSPYEEPEHPEIVVESDKMSIEQSVQLVLNYLIVHAIIHSRP